MTLTPEERAQWLDLFETNPIRPIGGRVYSDRATHFHMHEGLDRVPKGAIDLYVAIADDRNIPFDGEPRILTGDIRRPYFQWPVYVRRYLFKKKAAA